MVLCQLLT